MSDPRQPGDELVAAAVETTERLTGVVVPEYRWPILGAELQRCCKNDAPEPRRLEELLRSTPLVDLVTVPESYLFRHQKHFRLLTQLARERRTEGRSVVVVCAGCATGEEVWSAAAVLAAVPPPAGKRHRVVGWEISGARVARAAEGRFNPWSARQGLGEYERFFSREGDLIVAGGELREMVSFECVNLVSDPLPRHHRADALLFRNVSIYWRDETVRQVCRKLADVVERDGVILVGPSDPVIMPPSWQHRLCGGTRAFWHHDVACPGSCSLSARPAGARGPDTGCKRSASRPPAPRPSRTAPPAPRQATAAHQRRISPPVPSATAPQLQADSSDDAPELLEQVACLADQARYTEALELLGTSPDRDSLEGRLWHGILLLSLDHNQQALNLFRQCVYLAPEVAEHHHWLAMAYDALGEHQRADKQRRNAVREESR